MHHRSIRRDFASLALMSAFCAAPLSASAQPHQDPAPPSAVTASPRPPMAHFRIYNSGEVTDPTDLYVGLACLPSEQWRRDNRFQRLPPLGGPPHMPPSYWSNKYGWPGQALVRLNPIFDEFEAPAGPVLIVPGGASHEAKGNSDRGYGRPFVVYAKPGANYEFGLVADPKPLGSGKANPFKSLSAFMIRSEIPADSSNEDRGTPITTAFDVEDC